MPPAVIDLTSSPEPDHSTGVALQTWRPRKKKEKDSASDPPERQRDSEVASSPRAAQAILSATHSTKAKTDTRSNNVASALQPAQRTSRIQDSDYVRTQPPTKPKQKNLREPKRPQEGSLASLLEIDARQSFRLPASQQLVYGNTHQNETTPEKLSLQSSPVDAESERIQVLSKFQKQRDHASKPRSPPETARRAHQSHESPLTNAKNTPAISSPADFSSKHSNSITDSSKAQRRADHADLSDRAPLSVDDSDRPMKRRRLDESDLDRSMEHNNLKYSALNSAGLFATKTTARSQSIRNGIPIRSASPASIPVRPTNVATGITGYGSNERLDLQQTAQDRLANGTDLRLAATGTDKQANKPETLIAEHDRMPAALTPPIDLRKKAQAQNSFTENSTLITVATTTESGRSRNRNPSNVVSNTHNTTALTGLRTSNVKVGGGPYTEEEDALLKRLKEVDQLSWDEIASRFAGSRSRGSLQVRYSTTLNKRDQTSKLARGTRAALGPAPVPSQDAPHVSESTESDIASRPIRKKRNNEVSATAGFVSWAEVKKRRLHEEVPEAHAEESFDEQHVDRRQFTGERAYPRSLLRILRQRELASSAGRNWISTRKPVPDELKHRALDSLGPSKYYKGTSGDVTCLAWSPNGENFAAGSIAITDERSMQYNRPNNLLLGRHERDVLHELPEHHVQRPDITDSGNTNALHSMKESQDPRLFMTVANVQFSPDSNRLYSAGSDRKVRAYEVHRNSVNHLYALDHDAPLDLLSVSNVDILATACHQSSDKSIAIFKGKDRMLELSPDRKDEQTSRAIYPSALRWGAAYQHAHYLLAGFSIDSTDDERNIAGETCLWNIQHEMRLPIHGITRNVFDVAWNPTPSSTSSIFAVASSRGTGSVSRSTRSVVQCFGANARRTIGWECPAFDINDVLYCKHDDNIIAVGATDGKVYIWDQRFADRNSRPLHILGHGDTLNVLDHEREREIADTGVRFLSWGATSSRLYTGSSDGVIKLWNPYRSTEDAHIKDIASFNSAIMSGAFSPDDRDLLIGEDQGQLNLLSIGYEHKAIRSMRRFELQSARAPEIKEDRFAAARYLIASEQVSLKPMGDFPKRQAVQGPNYCGPYLRPSVNEITRANEAYELALNSQHEAGLPFLEVENNDALRQATKRVQEAQDQVLNLQRRLDDSLHLVPAASENQRRFLHAEKARAENAIHGVTPCKLDCEYLPSGVEDGLVLASRRSEMRIPGALRSLRSQVTSMPVADEVSDYEKKCISCCSPTFNPSKGKQPLCERCIRTRNGLTAACDLCANPVRPSTENSISKLCEKCSFACFRCGEAAMIPRDVSLVTCGLCSLTWRAGVLGYELIGEAKKDTLQPPAKKSVLDDPPDNLGLREMEHYASKWYCPTTEYGDL